MKILYTISTWVMAEFGNFSLKDWRTTKLDGTVLDYLGVLVAKGHIDPVSMEKVSIENLLDQK